MGKPAARLLDMTAHGGVITGPGCPTVLIGKMPAARMTDMHTCPMVTPPAVPHVGGPLVGPVPPTVFIGKLPAACMGDMATCAGPPSTVLPPGCPTVLLGQSGGGGGGGGGGSAASASSARPDSATAPSSIEGLESLPIEVQQAAAEAAQGMSPRAVTLMVETLNAEYVEQGSGGEAEETTKLTLADFREILEAVESEESYEAARHFASHLDFAELTALARAFTDGIDPNPDNDPNGMPTRFMLLYGADDTKLQQIDDHPDRFDGEEHKITVANLRKGLRLLGYEVAEEGAYDEELLQAHLRYLSTATSGVSPEALDELYDDETTDDEQPKETGTLKVSLKIEPDDADAREDSYILYSTDRERTYQQVKTVKDDTIQGNDTLDLTFTDVDKSLRYTLEIDKRSSGRKVYIFRNRAYGKWFDQ